MYPANSFNLKIRRYLNRIIPMIGIALIALMLGLIWFWETSGRELYLYQEVIVLNQDVIRGTAISDEMIRVEKIEADKIINEAITNKSAIIGFEAKHFIPKKSQLHPQYFENSTMLTDEFTFIVRVPNEWLYSIPNTLRRKDKVIFYQINSGIKEGFPIDNRTPDNNQIATYRPNEVKELKQILGNIVLETNIAYVKDSANREVVTLGLDNRLVGSSIISELLIIATPEEFEQLAQYALSGKLIIMYSEGGEASEAINN